MRTTSILAVSGLLAWSGVAAAQTADTSTPTADTKEQPTTPPAVTPPASTSGWQLHGFADISFKNDYITPRGLVVTTQGVTSQILDGLVFVSPGGIAFTAGTWTDLNPGYSRRDGNISTLNEFDFFFGISGTVAQKWKWGAQYVQFVSGQPSVAFHDERNAEFSLTYDDKMSKNFSINPYAKFFWAFDSKSSTVVTGKAGGTFDVELGVVPTTSLGAWTFSAPTWVTVGPKTYWAAKDSTIPGVHPDGNLGVFTTGLKISTPVKFVNSGVHMNVYAQGQYYHSINDNLVVAKGLLNAAYANNKRDMVVFGVGMGFGF
jgi:hypothetical protein